MGCDHDADGDHGAARDGSAGSQDSHRRRFELPLPAAADRKPRRLGQPPLAPLLVLAFAAGFALAAIGVGAAVASVGVAPVLAALSAVWGGEAGFAGAGQGDRPPPPVVRAPSAARAPGKQGGEAGAGAASWADSLRSFWWRVTGLARARQVASDQDADSGRLPAPLLRPLLPGQAAEQAAARLASVTVVDFARPVAADARVLRAVEADMQAGTMPASGMLTLTTTRSSAHLLASSARRAPRRQHTGGDAASSAAGPRRSEEASGRAGDSWAALGSGPTAFPSHLRVGAAYFVGLPLPWDAAVSGPRPDMARLARDGSPSLSGGGVGVDELVALWDGKRVAGGQSPGAGAGAGDAAAAEPVGVPPAEAWDRAFRVLVAEVARLRPLPLAAFPACSAHMAAKLDLPALLRREASAAGIAAAVGAAAQAAKHRAAFAECGVVLYFPADLPEAKAAVLLLARLLGRPAVSRWSEVAWSARSATVVHSLLPTSAASAGFAASAPAARLPHGATAARPLGAPVVRGSGGAAKGPGEFVDEMGNLVVAHAPREGSSRDESSPRSV